MNTFHKTLVQAIKKSCSHVLILAVLTVLPCRAQQRIGLQKSDKAMNPILWADVTDMSVVRTGDPYHMSSTIMYMYPNVPAMKSKDLVIRETVSCAIDNLPETDVQNLNNGKNDCGRVYIIYGAGAIKLIELNACPAPGRPK